jgi:hypothetical protein
MAIGETNSVCHLILNSSSNPIDFPPLCGDIIVFFCEKVTLLFDGFISPLICNLRVCLVQNHLYPCLLLDCLLGTQRHFRCLVRSLDFSGYQCRTCHHYSRLENIFLLKWPALNGTMLVLAFKSSCFKLEQQQKIKTSLTC